jgi:hypothetical protein
MILKDDPDWTVINLKAIAGQIDPLAGQGEPSGRREFEFMRLNRSKKILGPRFLARSFMKASRLTLKAQLSSAMDPDV